MLKAIIVDDEQPARDELTFLLSQLSEVDIIGEADNGPAAVALAARCTPDVVFLDIQMRGMSGIDTALAIKNIAPQALIVFATAYDEYAIKAFEVGAVDYLLKPFEADRVAASIRRLEKYGPDEWQTAIQHLDNCLATTAKQSVHKLAVEKSGKIFLIDYDDIIYIGTQTGNISVIAQTGEYAYSGTLTELQARLAGTSILRVHRSYLVHMEKVKEVIPWFKGTYWLKIAVPSHLNDLEIPVGKGQIKKIKEILGLK